MRANAPVGFFDSGLGGISVLRQTRKLLPAENYLYFGDSRYAPYGVRSTEQVQQLCLKAAEELVEQGIKALVIACNTATSAAAELLRKTYPELIVIGTEPALKPAVEQNPKGRILVLATAMTLKEQKFSDLRRQYEDAASIIPVACSGLMEFVERGDLDGPAPKRYLQERLEPYCKEPVDAVVLGCTHYPFLQPLLQDLLGGETRFYDGAAGVARQLCRLLEERGLRNTDQSAGQVEFRNSLGSEEILRRSQWLLDWNMDE